jgi:hypothetical protein
MSILNKRLLNNASRLHKRTLPILFIQLLSLKIGNILLNADDQAIFSASEETFEEQLTDLKT